MLGGGDYSPVPAGDGIPWYLNASTGAGGSTAAPSMWGTVGEKMDPATLAMISAGSQVLGKALSPSSAGPSRADSGGYNVFDNSGFAVSFGGDATGPGARAGDASASATGGLSPMLIGAAILGGVVVLVVWMKRKH